MEQHDQKTSREILLDIGSTIAAERERQGLTLSNVSQRLRILESHLEYIEAGNIDELPAMTYVIGYVRSYARMLGLDDAQLCADLKNSLSSQEDNPEFNFVENKLNNKNGAGRVALAAVIAGILIYGGWYSLSVSPSSTPQITAEVVQEIPAEETALTEEAPQVEPELVVVAPRTTPEVSVQNDDASENVSTEVSETVQPEVVEEVQEVIEEAATVPAEVNTNASEITKVTDAYAVNRTPDTEIVIEAIANSWVEVTRADGTSVTSRLMRLGDTYLIPTDEDLYLTTGNAGGLNIRMGSDDPFTLGSWGEALRELPLNKAVISERY